MSNGIFGLFSLFYHFWLIDCHLRVILVLYTISITKSEVFMKRQIPALVATFLITGFMTLALSVVGVNAMYNKANIDASTSQIAQTTDVKQAEIAQLEALVSQYKQREVQYQQREQQYQQQIQQSQQQAANATSTLQQLLQIMQQSRLIRISQNGQITIIGQPGF
jgi:predicted PurR-regulated permease PerM